MIDMDNVWEHCGHHLDPTRAVPNDGNPLVLDEGQMDHCNGGETAITL
jgi:hypothetical protein